MIDFISTQSGKWIWSVNRDILINLKLISVFKVEMISDRPRLFSLKVYTKTGAVYAIDNSETGESLIERIDNSLPTLYNSYIWDYKKVSLLNKDEITLLKVDILSSTSVAVKAYLIGGSSYTVYHCTTSGEAYNKIIEILL